MKQATTTDRTEARRRDGFRAMGTDVSLYGPDGEAFDEAFAAIRRVFETEERRFSRFRDDSELTAVNRLAGRWVPVSSPFERVVRLALDQASATGGLFDPTVLHALMAAGYDRDFDEVLAGARGALHPPEPCGRWTEVQVRHGAVRLPPEVGLDLGGIAKGWTVDLAAADALDAGLAWAVVAAGGDLAIVGDAPVLEIPIEDPETLERPMATLRLDQGALATSSVAKRAWGRGLHHVIDPRTGAPLRSDTVQATVWAPTCAEAEVLATWALLRGPDAAKPAALRHRRLQRRRHRELRPGGGPMTNWNLLRAAGIGAYLMLYLAVAWGLVATTSIISKRISKASSNLFHQFVATTGLVLLGVHLALLLIDGFMPFAPLDLILPLRSTYRPIPITLGIAAMFAMVVIMVSSWLRKPIGVRLWRAIHLAAVPAFALALGHGVFAGTDTNRPWMAAMYAITGLSVVFLTIVRGLTYGYRPPRAERPVPARVVAAKDPEPASTS